MLPADAGVIDTSEVAKVAIEIAMNNLFFIFYPFA